MKLVFSETPLLTYQSYLTLIYFLLIPIGVLNDLIIMEDPGSAIFNIVFSTLVFLSILNLRSKQPRARLLASLALAILFLFSVVGILVFAYSPLTYILFIYHLTFALFSLFTLWFDQPTKTLFLF